MMLKSHTPLFCLGVIPARGGSKTVPDKNIRPFAGKSLVQITIEVARQSELLNQVVVSTDSEKIAAIARNCGGCIPFIRPKELGGDDVPVWQVAMHAGQCYMEEHGAPPDVIVTLQPTSPLREAAHIDTGICMLVESDADAVLSLTEAEHTPYKMRVIEDGYIHYFLPEQNVLQRQDAPPAYRLNGVVYATRWDNLVSNRSLWGDKTLPYVLPPDVSFNIDSMLDFEIAEWLYLHREYK